MKTEQQIKEKLDAYRQEIRKCNELGDDQEVEKWISLAEELKWVLDLKY